MMTSVNPQTESQPQAKGPEPEPQTEKKKNYNENNWNSLNWSGKAGLSIFLVILTTIAMPFIMIGVFLKTAFMF
jgi:hypothetical protein